MPLVENASIEKTSAFEPLLASENFCSSKNNSFGCHESNALLVVNPSALWDVRSQVNANALFDRTPINRIAVILFSRKRCIGFIIFSLIHYTTLTVSKCQKYIE